MPLRGARGVTVRGPESGAPRWGRDGGSLGTRRYGRGATETAPKLTSFMWLPSTTAPWLSGPLTCRSHAAGSAVPLGHTFKLYRLCVPEIDCTSKRNTYVTPTCRVRPLVSVA